MTSVCWGRLSCGHAVASIVLSVFLGSSMMQAVAQESTAVHKEGQAGSGDLPAISGQLEEIRETLRRLEGLIGQVVERQVMLDSAVTSLNEQARLAAAVEQVRLDAAVAALNQQAQLTAAIGRTPLHMSQARSSAQPVATGVSVKPPGAVAKAPAASVEGEPRASATAAPRTSLAADLAAAALPSSAATAAASSVAPPRVLEIDALGGVSEEELTAIVDWIRQVHGVNRSARILVEPVLPLDSVDPDSQRRHLINEAGRVIDHVFEELNQKVDISTLVSEPVPGPRLRLLLANA